MRRWTWEEAQSLIETNRIHFSLRTSLVGKGRRPVSPLALARVGLAGPLPAPGWMRHAGPLRPNPNGYDLTFSLQLFQGDGDLQPTVRALEWMLRALTEINMDFLRSHAGVPGIYESGVRYRSEMEGEELWQDIPTALAAGYADCEDLASWRAAELQVRHGIEAWPSVVWDKLDDGRYLFHIQVRHPDGRIEDPSVALGMPA